MKKVMLAAFLMFAAKLWVSWQVYGSNDITYWMQFADIIKAYGTFKIYALCPIYNHPPLISWILKAISWAHERTGIGFPFIFRLMPITADFFSILIIWKLLKEIPIGRRTAISLACVLNPINFLVSAFHGNTDPVFVFFVLWAVYLVQEGKTRSAGMAYGISICFKIVPLILLPVFFYALKDHKQRVAFFVWGLCIPLMVFLPYLAFDGHAVMKNVFAYGSLQGIWGLGHFLAPGFLKFYTVNFKIIFFLTEIILARHLAKDKQCSVLQLVFMAFSLFLVMTPGFGIQYLAWLSYFAVLAMPLWGSAYLLLGGIFLLRVYLFWGGARPPYYANSIAAGQWGGADKTLDMILWLVLIAMLAQWLTDHLWKKQT